MTKAAPATVRPSRFGRAIARSGGDQSALQLPSVQTNVPTSSHPSGMHR